MQLIFRNGENHGFVGCPHEIEGKCTKISNLVCDPGMKGCVLAGRYVFTGNDEKNKRYREKLAREAADSNSRNDLANDKRKD